MTMEEQMNGILRAVCKESVPVATRIHSTHSTIAIGKYPRACANIDISFESPHILFTFHWIDGDIFPRISLAHDVKSIAAPSDGVF